jgi:hypothetical protein
MESKEVVGLDTNITREMVIQTEHICDEILLPEMKCSTATVPTRINTHSIPASMSIPLNF